MPDISNFPKQSYFRVVLQSPITAAQTSNIVLSDVPEYTPTGETVYLNILDPDNPETISCTGWNNTTNILSGVTRGVAKYTGGGSTASAHGAGIGVVLSNDWNYYADTATAINSKVNVEGDTMTGRLAFSGASNVGIEVNRLTTAERNALVSPQNGAIIYNTSTGEFNIYQGGAWSVMSSGSTQPDASTTVAGKVELATQSELNAGTATGGTGASLVPTPDILAVLNQNNPQKYATSGGSSNAYTLTLTPAVTAYTAGQEFCFLSNFANTGSATLNVNGLGTKTIKAPNNNDLISGDIPSGRIVKVVYDGTNFVIVSGVTNGYLYTGSLTPTTNDILYYDGSSFSNKSYQTFTGSTLGKGFMDQTATLTSTAGTGTHGEYVVVVPAYVTASSAGARSAASASRAIAINSGGGSNVPSFEINTYVKYVQSGANSSTTGGCFGFAVNSTYTFADSVNSGALSSYGAVFLYVDGVLKTQTHDGSGLETNTINGITMTQYNAFRIVFNGTDVKFYINGNLVSTHTTRLVKTATTQVGMGTNTASSGRTAELYMGLFSYLITLS